MVKIAVEEIILRYRWYIRGIYTLIILGLFLLLLPSPLCPPRKKEKQFADTILGMAKKYDVVDPNSNVVLFNNHEFFFKYSDYGSVFRLSDDSNVSRLCSYIVGRIWDEKNSRRVYFIIATDADKSFHADSIDFIKKIYSRSLSDNLKRLRTLELRAKTIGDIVCISTVN
jgi:hypothetical protein